MEQANKNFEEIIKTKNAYFTIDPGSDGTGIAFFQHNYLIKSESFDSKKAMWRDKCDEICYKVDAFINYYHPKTPQIPVICEQPEFFETFKGLTAAKSDSLVKLTTLYGRFWQIAHNRSCIFGCLPAKKWKGQLNKVQTANRIEKLIGKSFSTTHECDAVGIGLFLQGKF